MSRAHFGRVKVLPRLRVQPSLLYAPIARHFSGTPWPRSPYTEHVQVPCASSGHVTVSLHDIARHPVLSPLIINLPAFPVQEIADVDSYLPRVLQRYPSATIHYRWPQRGQPADAIASHKSDNEQQQQNQQHVSDKSLHWPTPIHDTLAAFDFLTRTLMPPPAWTNGHSKHQRRDVYVYGSYLGAGLAASLALTEAHANEPMAVRGLLAINGIYNWTTFLPDHRVNKARRAIQTELGLDLAVFEQREDTGHDLGVLKSLVPRLFQQPANLFDPFASPVLFFHTAGMLVPPSFTERWRPEYPFSSQASPSPSSSSSSSSSSGGSDDLDPYDYVYSDPEDPPPPAPFPEAETDLDNNADTNSDSDASAIPDSAVMAPPPRRGYLAFPPRASSLKIPETLLLHSTPPPLPDIPDTVVGQRRRTASWKNLKNAENSFESQAMGLAVLMRRSVNKLELRDRMRWDEEFEDPEGEAARRVETRDIGEHGSGQDAQAEEKARQWLEERLG